MTKTWRVKTEADLPPGGPDVRVSWGPRLGEPGRLREDWCAFLADTYDQPVGAVHGAPRSFRDLLAETVRQKLGLWVTFPKKVLAAEPPEAERGASAPGAFRLAEFTMQWNGAADDSEAVADAIRRERSLGEGLQRFAFGSIPVFALGDEHVMKLFPPDQRAYFDIETAVLARIEGRLPIPTPRVLAVGERGPWLYLVMSRLSGCSLGEAWPTIDPGDRIRLMREAGAALAALHSIPASDLGPRNTDWRRFMDEQRASCRERQRARGLGSPWVEAVSDFVSRWMPRDDGARALLHTEVMREHFLVDRREGVWRVSGILDFEDALLGAPEYEWACAGIFLTCAEPGLLRALLDAYGAVVDEDLPQRIMAYALLHRYSDLSWYLNLLPVPDRVGDLESLARAWFAV